MKKIASAADYQNNIVPDSQKVCTGKDLASAISHVRLSPEESRTWARELREARKGLGRALNKRD